MRFIDAHLHTDMVEDMQLQKLVMMDLQAAIVPSPHMYLASKAPTTSNYVGPSLGMETTTAATLGFELFTSISVPFFGVNQTDSKTCLNKMPEYLKADRAVAIGEIGLDTGTDFEKELFREHLRIAKDSTCR